MKDCMRLVFLLLILCGSFITGSCQKKSLKVVIIRHGEKPDNGDNLNCQGLNRAMALPKVLYTKYGVVNEIYIPTVNSGNKTKSSRMFQTITPYAVKYNLDVNSSFDTEDYKHIAKDVFLQKGTVIVCWEHNAIPHIAKALGVQGNIRDWPDGDFDSIWIITYKNGEATLTADKEGLNPSANCLF
ncbi:histidine phosphatase family protein [Mucilaginibacter sp. BT774]|uniref:histidine phosphatase family protein n=1 Tax=Mucilaginibacter sp. BT774 TaxID=3062276 RepID=UPI0026756C97|nr:histidine phosphatase family protein [Mucilaginibacter sp. BT774]MDO3625471.1 histidine phosphatase family protein [Mucilaginibacter sp. BT774]